MSTSAVTIRTGLPGHGKTLNSLVEIHEANGGTLHQRGERDVYYHGIRDLTLPGWTEITDPLKWFTLPVGSIVVIDEAQKHWPAKGMAKGEPPESIAAVETLRHHGFNLHLITQDPKLLDHRLRRLCGCHIHYFRPFGMARTTRTEWQRVVNPWDYFAKKEAISTTNIKLNKKYFGVYKSAEIHTVKRKLPKKLLLIPLVLGVISTCGYLFYDTMINREVESPIAKSMIGGLEAGAAAVSSGVETLATNHNPVVRLSAIFLDGHIITAIVERDGVSDVVFNPKCERYIIWSCIIDGQRVVMRSDPATSSSMPAAHQTASRPLEPAPVFSDGETLN